MVWMNTVSVVLRVQSKVRRLLFLSLVSVLVTSCDTGVAGAENSVDTSLLQAEQVEQRLSDAASLVEGVANPDQGELSIDLSVTKPMLFEAARKAFDTDRMRGQILATVTKSGVEYDDAAAFSKAAAALSEGRRKIAKMYVEKDEVLGQSLESRLGEPDTNAIITQIVTLMASPELTVETAVAQQAADAALKLDISATNLEPDTPSRKELTATLPGLLSELRTKTVNEGRYSKETARLVETTNLTHALATLAKDDLSAIQSFYTSKSGQAKKQALVEGYSQSWHGANLIMLNNYFDALAEYLKKNPRLQ